MLWILTLVATIEATFAYAAPMALILCHLQSLADEFELCPNVSTPLLPGVMMFVIIATILHRCVFGIVSALIVQREGKGILR
jgi:hypothetical protein